MECLQKKETSLQGSEAEKSQKHRKPLVKDFNEHIICPLCRGYLIDATTLVECLHSFCRGCIVRRLKSGPKNCPKCTASAAQDPLVADLVLQKLVYLIVPGLIKSEQECRKHFKQVNPQCTNLEQLPVGAPEVTYEDLVSLSLSDIKPSSDSNTRYLKCPAGVTIKHLVRLLMLKRGWDDNNGMGVKCKNRIEMFYEVVRQRRKSHLEILNPAWTLVDLACIFKWTKEAPMKLFYRINQVQDCVNKSELTINNVNPVSTDIGRQSIENIQRPPTPPPSPKPPLNINKTSRHATSVEQYLKEFEAKKPRCEVTPVLRSPDPVSEEHKRKNDKILKLEHQHKRKKRRNKKVIAELAAPREDPMKLKFRLTQVPQKIVSNSNNAVHSKEKLIQMRAVRKEKMRESSTPIIHANKVEKSVLSSKEKNNLEKNEESQSEEKTAKLLLKTSNPSEKTKDIKIGKGMVTEVKNSENEASPKNEEVLRKLGLIAISEANKTKRDNAKHASKSADSNSNPTLEREKLEKQFRESKANRVRSLLAEKQMRDTLKSIMHNSKEPNCNNAASQSKRNTMSPAASSTSSIPRVRSSTPTTITHKRKDLPPLTPIRNSKRPNVTFSLSPFATGKCETPLDLSSPSHSSKESALDLSSNINLESTAVKSNSNEKPVGILRNSTSRIAASKMEKQQEDKKTQDTNLKTLSDTAVTLIGSTQTQNKISQAYTHRSAVSGQNIGGKVALRIPQPHQRISGFSMKMKPSIGVRHIPNPQAVVASQYRNQRTGFYGLAHQPP